MVYVAVQYECCDALESGSQVWIFVVSIMKFILLPFKKSLIVGWVTLFTLYCLIVIYYNQWFREPKSRDRANLDLTMFWGKTLMKHLGVTIISKGEPISSEPTLFVGNHMSYLDIPVFYTLRNATFVAKKEVSRWPVFGTATTAIGTIYVDRESMRSRVATSEAMRIAIKDRRQSVVIFPEGTSSLAGKPWRQGAIRMAEDAGLLVQPFTIFYTPGRPAAYIDDDSFITHLWHWVGSFPVEAHIHFFEPRKILDTVTATNEIQKIVQDKWHELDNDKRCIC